MPSFVEIGRVGLEKTKDVKCLRPQRRQGRQRRQRAMTFDQKSLFDELKRIFEIEYIMF